jgi:glycosyltransferase involved in cell wall biosynthesis
MTAMERMAQIAPDGWQVKGLTGWPRLGHGGPIPAPLRRMANLALDVGWLGPGAGIAAARHRLAAWFTPASLLPPALPRPSVVIMHNLAFLQVPELFPRSYREITERLHRLSARRATRIVIPSDFLRPLVLERLGAEPDRVRTVPWGIDSLPEPAAESGVDIPKPYALFVGQTQPHWNVGLLLDAWQRDVPAELSLAICAERGGDETALRQTVARARLGDRVFFTGQMPPDRKMALIRDARIFVDPSLAESFAKPALESMSQGIPSAVSNRGALREVTRGAALTFDAGDADELASVVSRLHQDESLRARLQVEGPQVAASYRWVTAAAAYWEEVEGAVARRPS